MAGVAALLFVLTMWGTGTLGTMVSGGQTTFGERNCTFSMGMGVSVSRGMVVDVVAVAFEDGDW